MREKPRDSRRERLNKIIARAGVASRRRADELIQQGLVTVNGHVERELGAKAIWGVDSIEIQGRPLPSPPKKLYVMLNKPFGYMSTLHDPEGRPIVLDLIKGVKTRVYPVGRLDFDSHGLLILTNDGDLAFRLAHLRFHIPRIYKVIVEGMVTDTSVKNMEQGVILEDGPTHPARATVLHRTAQRTVLRITMFEGRSREIRRIFEALGHRTLKLTRIGYGGLVLGGVKEGQYRPLTDEEVQSLRRSVRLH